MINKFTNIDSLNVKSSLLDRIDMKVILQTIKEKCPHKGIVKYSDEYVLENVYHVLKNITNWRALRLLHPDEKYNHYSIIIKRFHKWTDNNVFIIKNKYS